MREQLPKDGAAYPCGFEFDGWRCPQNATEGLHADDMPVVIPKLVAINGRAMCETHLQFFGK